ncbi:LysR family transcriptional regulator [Pusillimonas sp. MFBS29]|uniref:LysR family transcriptional regulator n=1 Tax=Pusillimonas sp. MFBS29 TaxID=2886690 RepID=UPI001D10265E|nr:LysR family transcriptional regulator [Pusillimonas sp. MFBS29]MCC2595577.1 LysR family transcriptional regulator [Pusillimonas sp. MFBS29]
MNIDLDALRTLVAAIDERSLARAAEREGLVTSAVSKRISELERSLGTKVLQRHNRGVIPTAAGSALYYRAKAILGQMSGLTSFIEDFASDGSPKIQLASNRSAIVLFLPREIKLYQEQQSQRLRIDLLESYSSEIPRLVVEKNLDLGIYHAVGPAPGVHSVPYHRDRVVLVVPNGHPLQRENAVYLDEAREFDFLGYFPRHSFEAFMELAGHSLTGPLNVKIQVSNYEARCKMIREGLGIGIMPEGIADTYIAQMGLVKVPLKDDWALRQFYLCVRDPETLRPSSRSLMDFFAQQASARNA